jgi:hypothetical protein
MIRRDATPQEQVAKLVVGLEEEIAKMREAFFAICLEAGEDMDGILEPPPPGVLTPDLPELAVKAVHELRENYNEALDE